MPCFRWGPFYHLTTEADRDRAAAEAYPVLLAAVMPRYLRLVATVLERGSAAFDSGLVARILNDGGYDDERVGRFTGGQPMRTEDVVPFFERGMAS